MKTKVRKAVFPAAGFGTRFLPATKAIPKEMLAVVDKPIIQYGVEEALAAGCEEIIIITARGKSAIEDHFDISYELEASLEKRGKTDAARAIAAKCFEYGAAILCTAEGGEGSRPRGPDGQRTRG